MSRVYLSPPEVGEDERRLLLEAFDSNWIAPVGPDLDAFESEVALRSGTGHAVGLSSGTAGLHLALLLVGVGPGDEVLVPSFTFVATASAVTYLGATPVLVDCSSDNWTLDPALVAEELDARARSGRLPRALVTVDLYGQSADYDALTALCDRYGLPLVEDAAEALGATYRGRPAGSFGRAGVFSFNGNKIITTSGGGMLVSDDADLVERARFLATQARDPFPHYEHSVLGFNYRLSNLLAALGRGQLLGLDDRMARRRAIDVGLPGRPGRRAGHRVHAHRRVRRAQLVAHLHHRRPRRLRRRPRADPIGPRGRGHRVEAHLEAAPPTAGVRGSTHRGGRGVRLHLRAGAVPAHRLRPLR